MSDRDLIAIGFVAGSDGVLLAGVQFDLRRGN
jgi:hypothetical protein